MKRLDMTIDDMRQPLAAVPRPGHPHYRASGHVVALCDLARWIRTEIPLASEYATNSECEERGEAIDVCLLVLNVSEEARAWWTLVCEEQPGETVPLFAGVWATSMEEALLHVVVWRPEFDGRHIATIAPDDGCKLHERLSMRRRAEELRAERDATAVTLW